MSEENGKVIKEASFFHTLKPVPFNSVNSCSCSVGCAGLGTWCCKMLKELSVSGSPTFSSHLTGLSGHRCTKGLRGGMEVHPMETFCPVTFHLS